MSGVLQRLIEHVAWLVCALLPAIGLAAEEEGAPRDAAEIVQEGDVSQWLKHYERERGADWARQQERAEPKPAAAASPPPPMRDSTGTGKTPSK